MTGVRIEETWWIAPKDRPGPSITYCREGRSEKEARALGIAYLREHYPEVSNLDDGDFICVPRDWEMGPVLADRDPRRQT